MRRKIVRWFVSGIIIISFVRILWWLVFEKVFPQITSFVEVIWEGVHPVVAFVLFLLSAVTLGIINSRISILQLIKNLVYFLLFPLQVRKVLRDRNSQMRQGKMVKWYVGANKEWKLYGLATKDSDDEGYCGVFFSSPPLVYSGFLVHFHAEMVSFEVVGDFEDFFLYIVSYGIILPEYKKQKKEVLVKTLNTKTRFAIRLRKFFLS